MSSGSWPWRTLRRHDLDAAAHDDDDDANYNAAHPHVRGDRQMRISAKGGPRPVVVFHGLLGQKRNFRSWCAALAEAVHHKRRIVTFDLRGPRRQPAWGSEYPSMAADVLATLESLKIKSAASSGIAWAGKSRWRAPPRLLR